MRIGMQHITSLQVFYTVLCLSVLGTSALKGCEKNRCEHKGKCSTEMTTRTLTCDNNAQQRDECDHHNPFEGKTLTNDQTKESCCQVTCYSLFEAKKFTCPVGHIDPTAEGRQPTSADKSVDDLTNECCKKPRVSCYTLLSANKFTCPSTHYRPTKTYLNDDIHEDMESKTTKELQDRCCRAKSLCHSKLNEKNLDCDGFGQMPEKDDVGRDGKWTTDANTDNSKLQKQCCKPVCFSLMTENSFSCPADSIMRESRLPGDTSEAGLKRECCAKNCYTRMKAKKLECAKGDLMKSNDDMHDPGDVTDEKLKEQCCETVMCDNNYCFAAMFEKGIWNSCPENTRTPDTCDGHWPFDNHPADKMTVIKAKTAPEITKACCRMACYGMMKSKNNLKCPAGYKGRGSRDGHNPFGNEDWTKKTDKEITDGCCQKINKCSVKLSENSLDCDGYGHMPWEFDDWKADADTSKLKTDEEIESTCCKKTCSIAMAQKNLECENSEKPRCDHLPSGWMSFEQPAADIKWACCEAGSTRPKFQGCQTLLKCSGEEECNSKCPGDERMRDSEHDNPFGDERDFTKMEEAGLLNKCCRPSCYDQVKRRELTCPVGTKMFDKHDGHNPFEWNVDMRAQSKEEILSKCCKPLNKCYTKLTQMSLTCSGIGKFPGDTDDTNYDFDPLKLIKADDVKSKCCEMNCFYALKKNNLQCTTGIARSSHDGHNPFGDTGFAEQTNERLLQECCQENCYSYFNTNALTCDAGDVRDKGDFHGVDFKNLKKPEDAKNECCRTGCADVLKSGCGEGYKMKGDEATADEWSRLSAEQVNDRCCEKLSEECKQANAEANKRTKWADKRPKTSAALVTYLNNWGDKVLKAKTTAFKYEVINCKSENKKFKTEEQCEAADKNCCFACEKADVDCTDAPRISTCADNEPSAFMKKFGAKECSTSGAVKFGSRTDCGACPSVRDLFEEYDDGTLFSQAFTSSQSGIKRATSAFYGGVNLHNVRSEVHISDNTCSQATAGLMVSARNSGIFTATGKKGTVYAIVGVVNEKSTDPTKGVQLSGAADYLLVGGSNEGNVVLTSTGQVSVVGMDNKGEVNVKNADNILIGNTVNSGKVILDGKTGAMVNVVNKAGAQVVVNAGTWEFSGPGTRNDGTVHLKSGKITAKVKENTGTITIADGVTGVIVICKNTGTITNNGQVTVSTSPDDPFCAVEVPKPTAETAPKVFFCRNAAKHAKTVFQEKTLCGDAIPHLKMYWEAFRHEVDSSDGKKFYSKCCDAKPTAPKGKKFILKQKTIKKKRVKAKTIVSLDFTDDKNKDKKEKFEKVFIKRANAKSGMFEYKKAPPSKERARRHLSQGTEVSANLEYEDDAAAEAGKKAVTATDFATGVGEDLKKEAVEIILTMTSAEIETVDEVVVEEVLVDDDSQTTEVLLSEALASIPIMTFVITLITIGFVC